MFSPLLILILCTLFTAGICDVQLVYPTSNDEATSITLRSGSYSRPYTNRGNSGDLSSSGLSLFFARFSTINIPDYAEIQSIDLLLWYSDHDNLISNRVSVRECSADPNVETDETVFNAIDSGLEYASFDSIPFAG